MEDYPEYDQPAEGPHETIFDSKNPLVKVIALSAVISALVGGVFGFYAARLSTGTGDTFISNITHSRYADESSAVSAIVKDYSPAVVSIVASKDVPVIEQQFISPFGDLCNDPNLRQWFGGCDLAFPQNVQKGTKRQDVAAGTGFIVRADGLIITNRHVVDVEGADYTVILNNGTKYPAQVLARDPIQDLAVVQIKATNLPVVKLGNSDNLAVGQTVIAIGNALGQFSNTVSKGIISGLARTITASEGNSSEQLERVIQTDAAINPGNSGGPLINLDGEVVGVNTAIASNAQSVGFTLPVNRVKKDIHDIETLGKITYPFLGVQYVLVTPDIQQKNKLTVDHGAFVTKSGVTSPAVVADSPAAKAGIQENDVIIEAAGQTVDQNHPLSDIIQSKEVGDIVSIKLNRAGKELTVQVTLTEKK